MNPKSAYNLRKLPKIIIDDNIIDELWTYMDRYE